VVAAGAGAGAGSVAERTAVVVSCSDEAAHSAAAAASVGETAVEGTFTDDEGTKKGSPGTNSGTTAAASDFALFAAGAAAATAPSYHPAGPAGGASSSSCGIIFATQPAPSQHHPASTTQLGPSARFTGWHASCVRSPRALHVVAAPQILQCSSAHRGQHSKRPPFVRRAAARPSRCLACGLARPPPAVEARQPPVRSRRDACAAGRACASRLHACYCSYCTSRLLPALCFSLAVGRAPLAIPIAM
jgi:hypothetical protein